MCVASKAICRPFQKTQNQGGVNNRRVDRMSAWALKVRSKMPTSWGAAVTHRCFQKYSWQDGILNKCVCGGTQTCFLFDLVQRGLFSTVFKS